ncbi:hypothetical protein [Arenibacterium halophilum]|uniref:Uncharacterized protein n=1 Tax=Arenibacterium halophilum TaxID=2583821 RepID=A0ABY2XBN0_9RHOB|nr:hypothetical protein [Arenibacterium halophilum]TMV14422.1 hypothetical protein FGK64_00045 [Arenibacterium halophilum]
MRKLIDNITDLKAAITGAAAHQPTIDAWRTSLTGHAEWEKIYFSMRSPAEVRTTLLSIGVVPDSPIRLIGFREASSQKYEDFPELPEILSPENAAASVTWNSPAHSPLKELEPEWQEVQLGDILVYGAVDDDLELVFTWSSEDEPAVAHDTRMKIANGPSD